MKKCAIILAVASLFILPACSGGKTEDKNTEKDDNTELSDSLQTAVAERDSLMSLMNDISNGMNQIKEMENLLSTSNLNNETVSKKQEINDNMILLQQALQSRREKLEALEAKLKKSSNYSSKMQETIESLKKQLESQETTISDLRTQLKNAHIQIEGLNVRVDSLKSENTNVSKEKKAAQEESVKLANELNTCYFAVGSKNELKKNKIIESGFLKKTKIMEGDFEKSYFTKADKRTLHQIPLHSKKAKVLSKHPAGSYEIVDNGGAKSLKINNPTKFWDLSNFLIIQID